MTLSQVQTLYKMRKTINMKQSELKQLHNKEFAKLLINIKKLVENNSKVL